MRKIIRNNLNKKIDKKQLSLILASTIALTSLAGCGTKVTEDTTTVTVTPTTIVATTMVPEATTADIVETKDNQASTDYMLHAKAVAEAMYEANKDYFDEKEYTVEDLENVYYVLNGKYYDNENNIIMDQVELNRSFDITRELVEPQRINEMLQKYRDVEYGYISYEEYMDEVNASVFYDYSASLSNFIDDSEDNKDIKKFADDYSEEMIKVTENVKNCVTPEEHLTEFFAKVRSAQTGNITDYSNINNYLQETTANDGYGFMVAGIYKSTADFLNTVIDGEFITVQDENVRIGLDYDERIYLNSYYLGDLVLYEDIYKAKLLENELFQTMPLEVMCDKQEKITRNFNFEQVKGKTKRLTI